MASGDEGISGFGTTVSGASTGALGRLIRVSVGSMEANDIDVSSMDSPNRWREFIAGMKNAGEIRLDILYDEDEVDAALDALGSDNETWTITFPDTATFVCDGYVKSVGPIDAPMDDKMAVSIGIKLSGEPTYTPPA